jgi:hypothetical protein
MFDFSRRYDPESSPQNFRWTAESQRRFLEILAASGSVLRACDSVSKSRKCAYALRRKSKAKPFAAGWDAALIKARDWISDQMLEYAFSGVQDVAHRHPLSRRLIWRRHEPILGAGLGMAHLNRLDKAVAAICADELRHKKALEALHHWPDFLNGISAVQPDICNLASNSAISHLQDKVDQAQSNGQAKGVKEHGSGADGVFL